VTGVHGDEPVPTIALSSMNEKQIVANPKALSLGKRYVECDLNSSFGKNGNCYEERLARSILRKIGKDKTVIDIHTFSAKSKPFVVIVDLSLKDFASSLGFEYVVYMRHNIKKGCALINYRKGVSIEIGKHKDPKVIKRVSDLVKRLRNKKQNPTNVSVYEVYGIINKPGRYVNFKKHSEGFIPVLAGEKAYSFYGLKAKVLK
jgi:succinylglutamate desuccinylase